jgi:WXXGXW repeat (2 copies)
MPNTIRSSRLLLSAVVLLVLSGPAFAQIGIGLSITIAPPALPVYAQPLCPAEGYIWTPGYWAYADGDYYWVPGTWVMAPEPGLLWTPGYWAWNGAAFIFNQGYWGPQVGFYGGINYGFGYFGQGYVGGRWNNGQFYYNRAVNNINVTNIKNVYVTQVNTTTVNRVSYNGGNGGITARPSAQDQAAARERHMPPVAAQTEQAHAAQSNKQLRASVNHGKPPIAATPKPGAFNESGVVAAKQAGAPYNPPANRAATQPQPNAQAPRPNPATSRAPAQPETKAEAPRPENGTARSNSKPAVHPNDLPPNAALAPPNTGNAERDRQYQQQQEELRAKQNQERQELQQKQEQDHQRMAQQKADQAKNQQLERQHQQQTQALQQKHAAETKQLQEEQRQRQAKSPRQEHPPTEKP